jgi:hypothetical protein
MTDAQCDSVQRFVRAGGNLMATGRSSLLDGWGEPRGDFALSEIFGVRSLAGCRGAEGEPPTDWEVQTAHSYIRLLPELNQAAPPQQEGGPRHPVLSGFDDTDILPFGGTLEIVEAGPGAQVVATYVPAYPIYPPEFSWTREPKTDIPAIVVQETAAGGRTVYLAGDIDRCHGRGRLPDHGDLLANAVRWALHGRVPLRVAGPGYLDCHLYSQGRRRIVHVINLTGCRAWPDYVEEHLPVGPVRVAVRMQEGFVPTEAHRRVSGRTVRVHKEEGWAIINLPSIHAHELIIME